MPIDHACASCGQPLQVPESYLGRDMACPACKHVFRLGPPPTAYPPPPPPPPPPQARWEERDLDFDRPSRRQSRREFENERDDRAYWHGKAGTANTLGLLSCVLCWIPLAGIILGIIAWSSASSDMARMLDERSGSTAIRLRFEGAKNMGITGLVLSLVLMVTCCAIRVPFMIR